MAAIPTPGRETDAVAEFAAAAVDVLIAAHDPELTPDAIVHARALLDERRVQLRASLTGESRLAQLAAHAELSAAQTELLAVLVGAEHDEALQLLLVSLTQDRVRHRVELWMLRLLDLDPTVAGPGSALCRGALLDLVPRGALGRTALQVPPRVLWALRGDGSPDPDLPTAVRLLTADSPADVGHDAVLVVGPDRVRRQQEALRLLGAARCLSTSPPTTDEGWAALIREATLAGAAVLLETDSPLDPDGRRRIEAATHLRWAIASRRALPLDTLPNRDWREASVPATDPSAEEWQAALGDDVPRRHHLTADQLDRMRQALAITGDAETAYRRLADSRLESLARHVVPRAGWDDLVLSPSRKARLRDFVDRYRMADVVYDDWGFPQGASRGLVALFSGPSGTGKTMGAEIVAGALGLDMYRLDISSVVSKYIGETEKNLDELFDAASIGNTVLFFDEADSLFGKRTEVSDAHDRYANVETSYLLQRLERYDGIVVLATNYERNIDEAFLRRVHVRVDFPMPSEAERLELWQRSLGPQAPVADDLDLPWLAQRFDLSGAAIRNAVVAGAFRAAAQQQPLGMAHLAEGVAIELQKLRRMSARDELGEWSDVVAAPPAPR